MKNLILISFYTLLIATPILIKAQTTYDFDNDFVYTVDWSVEDGNYTVTISIADDKDSFSLTPLHPQTFSTAFRNTFEKLLGDKKDNYTNLKEKLNNQATTILFEIQAKSIAKSDLEPKSGDIKLTEEITISKYDKKWKQKCNAIKKCGINWESSRLKKISNRLTRLQDILNIRMIDIEEKIAIQKISNLEQIIDSILKDIESDTKLNQPHIKDLLNEIKELIVEAQSDKTATKSQLSTLRKRFREIKKVQKKLLKEFSKCRKLTKQRAKALFYRSNSGNGSALRQYKRDLLKSARAEDINGQASVIADIEEDIQQAKATIDKNTEDIKKSREETAELNADNNSLNKKIDNINTIRTEIEQTKNQLENDKISKVVHQSKVDQLQKELEKTKSSLEVKESILTQISTIEKLLQGAKELKFDSLEIPSTLIKSFEITDSNGTRNSNSILEGEKDISELSSIKEKLERFIKSSPYQDISKDSLETIETELSKLEREKNKNEKEKSSLKEKKESLNQQLGKLEKQLEQIYYKKYTCSQKNDCIEEIQQRLQEEEDKRTTLLKKNKDLTAKIKQYKQEIESHKDKKFEQTFVVDSVQVEFHEGFIENIWVMGHVKRSPHKHLKFENMAPIPFSNKKDYAVNNSTYLVASDTGEVFWVLYMGEFLFYLQNHNNGTRDYSPANGTELWTDMSTFKKLKKEPTSRLFEAKVFSDFVGFDAQTPNGLVQTEISKRFNIWSKRFGSFLKQEAVYCNCKGPRYGANVGFFNFITPTFVFSKFEEKNRYLTLKASNNIINGQLQSLNYAATKDLLQYEIFNIGYTTNLVTLDIPLAKSMVLLNTGFLFGRTEIIDSTYQYKDNVITAVEALNYGINTIRLFSEVKYRIIPEYRYGFDASIRFSWMKGFTDQNRPFLQLNEAAQIAPQYNSINQWMIRFQINAFFRPSKDSDNKLFFRYRFNAQLSDFDFNFHQLQLGYSFYLLRNNNLKKQN